MKRRMLLLLPLLLVCGGCRASEPNELAIVSALAVDGAEGARRVSAELAALQGEDGQIEPTVLHADGPTVSEALAEIDARTGQQVWYSQAQVLLIGRDTAEQADGLPVGELMDRSELRLSMRLAVCDPSADGMLGLSPRLASMEGMEAGSILRAAAARSETAAGQLYRFYDELHTPGVEPILPFLRAEGEKLSVGGCALFRGTRMIGTVDPLESRWLLLLRGDARAFDLSFPGAVFRVKRVRRTVRVTPEGAEIILRLDADAESGGSAEQQRRAAQTVEEGCRRMLAYLQERSCDAVGLGRALSRQDADGWHTVADAPEQWFAGCPVEVYVELRVRSRERIEHG